LQKSGRVESLPLRHVPLFSCQEKEELDKPAKTRSDVIQLQNCVLIRLTGLKGKIPAARPEILLMPCSCFTSVGAGCRANSTLPGRPSSSISLPS
jgi:hypothetical protein